MDDTEEGEILEDGEIQDEDDVDVTPTDHKSTLDYNSNNTSINEEKENNINRDKDFRDNNRDSRKREDRPHNNNRDKDKNRRSDRERDRDRRDRYDRKDRSERDRKSSSTDRDRRDSRERDRKISSASSEDERRRKERLDRKRRFDDRLNNDRQNNDNRLPGPTGTRTGLNRPPERQMPFKQICKYFLEGKCNKGVDCPFSHDALPPKKKELCKFYLQGFCGKGEDCLFMHSEFPCKFFHTNVECYSGDNCRFSHSPLTEDTRQILRNYLDSGTLPDDPKPERQHNRHSDIDSKNANKDSNNQNNNYSNNCIESQTNSENHSQNENSDSVPHNNTTNFVPIKPVVKRHALLGDPTHEMKTSHITWVWQQEMKELEDAYVGNKRNLFCIEKPFVISKKPSTPRMEDDEEEIEAQIRNYYKDTMPEFEEEADNLQVVDDNPMVIEEQKLIEASAHDEDLRTFMRPTAHNNDLMGNYGNDVDERSQPVIQPSVVKEESQSVKMTPNVPKVGIDLYLEMQNKQNESEFNSNELHSDSDDDENVLAAALKNVQQSYKQSPTNKISQMLSIIRNSSANNTTANQSPKQSEFWQNIMSGIHMAGVTGSPSGGNNTPPRTDYRDPRLNRGKESMSPSVNTTPPVKICDPNVKIEYKLVGIATNDIDYSTYVSLYRIDARLKNDPRLQKFFSKLPSSEIDNLSRICPPPLKPVLVTPLSVLKSKKKLEKENQMDREDGTPKADSPTLPPLPPLTISPSKSAPTLGIFPPTPPPIMSPLELISGTSRFGTVGAAKDSPSLNIN